VWRARDPQETISYLSGTGQFGDRQRFPLPDAVLLDVRLPGIEDGFETLEWIVSQKQRPKVVMMTVMQEKNIEEKARQAGADEFKLKPYDDKELRDFVQWLDEWAARAPTPPQANADALPSRIHSPKPASPGKPRLQGSARGECEADPRRRLKR
jgi:CheY-like chemotaxis protein